MSPSSSPVRRASRISILTTDRPAPDRDLATLDLPARLDFGSARDLHAGLMARRGLALAVDGSAVTFCGALAAQVLISASRETTAAGETFVLRASPALHDDLSRLGVLGEFSNLVEVAEC